MVESNKLETSLKIGTLEQILDINSLILQMASMLLVKEEFSFEKLKSIIDNL